MIAKHTAGPWVIDEYLHDRGFYKLRGADAVLCHVWSFADSAAPESEATANARLIAAAPDLLAAAEAALTELDDRYDYSDDKGEKPFAGAGQLMETLRAAIAKARQS